MVTNCLGFLLVPFLLVFWEFVHFIYFVTQSCLTLHDSIDSSTPGFPVFYYLPSLLKLVHWVGDAIHFILCRPLLPWVFPSIGVFSSESALHIRWVKYRSLSFSISPSNEYSGLTGLISLLSKGLSKVFSDTTVQNQFFSTQPFLWSNSHPYMTTGKTIVLNIWSFVGKVMPLLFSMLSRLVIALISVSKPLNFIAIVTIYSDFGAQEK